MHIIPGSSQVRGGGRALRDDHEYCRVGARKPRVVCRPNKSTWQILPSARVGVARSSCFVLPLESAPVYPHTPCLPFTPSAGLSCARTLVPVPARPIYDFS